MPSDCKKDCAFNLGEMAYIGWLEILTGQFFIEILTGKKTSYDVHPKTKK